MFPRLLIKNGSFKQIHQKLKTLGAAFTIITDGNLKKLGEELRASMKASGLATTMLIIPAGEHTKSISFVEKAARSLIKLGAKRDTCLIALGGGVVSDIVGFLASIYMRGIPFVSVPTTLLAMCDASIGGKTGVDLPEGKNLLGTFYHPKLIIMDPMLLKTLPEREFRCGMAEVIKHGIIADRTFFTMLKKNFRALQERRPKVLEQVVKKSAQIKMRIVGHDEKESLKKKKSGTSRMLLNYGHTVGHALEQLSNYTLPHGEAVSIGMVAENRIAVGKNIMKQHDAAAIVDILKLYRLPTKIPPQYSPAEIKRALALDKKNVDGTLHFALPTSIGKAKIFTL